MNGKEWEQKLKKKFTFKEGKNPLINEVGSELDSPP